MSSPTASNRSSPAFSKAGKVQLPTDIRLMRATTLALGVVLGVGLVIAAGLWLMQRPVFDLRAIRIEGNVQHNNALTLRVNVAPRLAGNFFSVDLRQTQAAFEAIPWIRKAVVQRQFPNRLKVTLQEHQPVALWGPDSESSLVNSFGEVFEANRDDVESQELPLLSGPSGQAPQVLAAYQALTPVFALLDLGLERFELTGRGSWRARLDSGATVELGQGSLDEITARARRFVATLTQVSSKFGRSMESADLRYANGYALKLRGVSTN